jgi:peptidoglycan/LPS O-acetylase OafA/YrhL
MGILRFLLALAVAAGHASGFFNIGIYPSMAGSRAVQIFYMISGFLIALILNGKYASSSRGNWIFYSNRAIKIFVPYFAILAPTILLSLAFYLATGDALSLSPYFNEAGNMTATTWLYTVFTNIFLIGQEWSFLLIYRAGQLFYSLQAYAEPPIAFQFVIIGPAWTLSIELMFYLIAPFILRRHFLLIAALAYASYYFRFQSYHFGYYSEATDYRFFPFELSLFLYGALSQRVYAFLKARELSNKALSVSTTAVVAVLVASLPTYLNQNQYQLYALIGLLLPILFDFSNRYRWDRWLGDLSYPLYLVHWPVMVFGLAIVSRWLPDEVGKTSVFPYLALATSIGLAIAINHLLVYPIDAWRQSRVRDLTVVGEPSKLVAATT